MFWQISFWVLAVILILPLPFRIHGYLYGRDKSPVIVKVEEIGIMLFFAVGLVGFYGYLHHETYMYPNFWKGWLIVCVSWSLLSFFWSPKLNHVAAQIGKMRMLLIATLSLLVFSPMFVAVYLYAYKI